MGRMDTERSTDMTALANALRGTPQTQQQFDPQEAQQSADQGTPMPFNSAVPGDPNQAAMIALQSRLPDVRQMAPGLMQIGETRQNRQDDREFRSQESALNRESRMKELEMRAADQRASAAERIAAQREIAQMRIDAQREAARDRAAMVGASQAQAGKPPAGYRFKPNGDLEKIPGGPADEKAAARDAGGETVSGVIASLRDQYDQLDKAGGITNPAKGSVGNLAAGIQSSGVGQATGRLFGTQNQSARNTIAQQRPILLQAIMKATGMSAKQMDSNAELKLYLATATDPTLDVAANRRALDMIEKLYGVPTGAKPGASGDWAIVK
jgi:hypothetical protein